MAVRVEVKNKKKKVIKVFLGEAQKGKAEMLTIKIGGGGEGGVDIFTSNCPWNVFVRNLDPVSWGGKKNKPLHYIMFLLYSSLDDGSQSHKKNKMSLLNTEYFTQFKRTC